MKPVLKICGLMRPEDVEHCLTRGVDILGFVTEYPVPVPWNLTRRQAAKLLDQMNETDNRQALSCLVTGGSPDFILELATELKPDLIQLHYRENLADTRLIAAALKQQNIGVIKTVPTTSDARLEQFGTADLMNAVKQLNYTDIHALLVDSRAAGNAAHGGQQIDPDFCRLVMAAASKPVMIAGGITPDNVIALINKTGAEMIDIMTGVETAFGVKDVRLLDQLIDNITNTDYPFHGNHFSH